MRKFAAALILALCSCSQGPAPAPHTAVAGAMHPGKIVMVSAADAQRDHAEMTAAADPADSSRMLACSSVFLKNENARVDVVYATFDGGASWKPVFTQHTTRYNGDPACAYGLGNTAWLTSLSLFGGPHEDGALWLFRSSDQGRTWRRVARRGFMDREYVSVDRTHSPFRGTVYVYAHDAVKGPVSRESVQLMRYVKGALTKPVYFGATKPNIISSIPSRGVITDRGTLVIPFYNQSATGGIVWVTASQDGGLTLTKPVRVATYSDCPHADIIPISPMAIDESSSPFHGRMYIALHDRDYESKRCLIKVTHSDDNGKTWSDPAPLYDDVARTDSGNGPEQSEPAIAVNRNGIVGLSWYDTRDDVHNRSLRFRFAVSYDGGDSFEPSVAPSQGIYDARLTAPNYLRGENSGGDRLSSDIGSHDVGEYENAPGHTSDMVADASGLFHPFWIENQTGIPELLTQAVAVNRRAARNGDPSLARLQDVTKYVRLRYTSIRFDPGNATMTMRAVLVNHSGKRIAGPLRLRLLSTDSPYGLPTAANASNGRQRAGAIWNLDKALSGRALAPWSESPSDVTLVFKMHDRPHQERATPHLSFDAKIFGVMKR